AGAIPCMNCEGVFRPLQTARGERFTPQIIESLAREAMTEDQWLNFTKEREANLAYMSREAGRYRVNVFWQRGSVAMVLRRVIMDIPTLRQLGLPPKLRDIALEVNGIVPVT